MIRKIIKKIGKKFKKISGSAENRSSASSSSQSQERHTARDENKPKQQKEQKSTVSSQRSAPKRPPQRKKKNPSHKTQVKSAANMWKLDDFPVPPVAEKSRFHDLDLPLPIMHAIADLKFSYCTPIQALSLPQTLTGSDMIGRAQTGTGKSAAFLITMFARILRHKPQGERPNGAPRAMIIAPTRELVYQISKDAKELAKYCNLHISSVYGGVDYQKQKTEMENNKIDLMVATPGRLLDYLRQRIVRLDKVEVMVLDEADRMLDMGFIPDVRRIIHHTPEKHKRQTMMFSATITEEVKHLASQWCQKACTVDIEPDQVAVDTVEQVVYLTTGPEKYTVLYNIINRDKPGKVMVFTNRKDEARKLTERLKRNNINCAMLSGDVPQKQRMGRLESFRAGKIKVLVATDVAGRGIHIDGISHVVNYTLPYEPEDYVHRIGRTGRAGAKGISISFACEEGGFYLPDIEELLGHKLECKQPEEELLVLPPKGTTRPSQKQYHAKGKPRHQQHRRGNSHQKARSAGKR